MTPQSKLLALIANTEATLQADEMRLADHKLYFANLGRNHSKVFISLLIPAFFVGWRVGKQPNNRKWLTKLTKDSLFNALSSFRNYYPLW